MLRHRRRQGGFSLLIAMVVVVLLTLLVVGAIEFTGVERSAAVLHTRDEDLSSCVEAARNMFVSRVRVLHPDAVVSTALNGQIGPNLTVTTGHFTGAGVSIQSVAKLPNSVMAAGAGEVSDISNRPGTSGQPGYYRVTAVCQQGTTQQREIEFAIRVGI